MRPVGGGGAGAVVVEQVVEDEGVTPGAPSKRLERG
ncbi:hypothetical protein GGQ69_000782 [Micrococcus sp. TA1]|nr:hypothetical protein [Micrococcus sp. TA1]